MQEGSGHCCDLASVGGSEDARCKAAAHTLTAHRFAPGDRSTPGLSSGTRGRCCKTNQRCLEQVISSVRPAPQAGSDMSQGFGYGLASASNVVRGSYGYGNCPKFSVMRRQFHCREQQLRQRHKPQPGSWNERLSTSPIPASV